jgi:hypothetical protein
MSGEVPDPAASPALLATVERIIGGGARAAGATLLKRWERNDVWRVLLRGAPGAPGSVIVKQWKSQPARGLDEWAALALFTAADLERPPGPRFLGGDAAVRCFVMEDLGAGPSLETLLRARDAGAGQRAGAAIVEIARRAGQMHADGRGLAVEFDRLRDALELRPLRPAAVAARGLHGRGADLAGWLAAVGASRGAGTDDALVDLAAFVGETGEWTTVTHGDMAPGNTALAADGWRLLDFEYTGVRPALYDALLWTLFCPFPSALIEAADGAYRETLGTAFPLAHDDLAYAAARARTAAWRTLDQLHWMGPALLDADRAWAPGMGARHAVLWHLARFRAVAMETPDDAAVAPIAEVLNRLEARLVSRWGPAPDPAALWPAFAAHQV